MLVSNHKLWIYISCDGITKNLNMFYLLQSFFSQHFHKTQKLELQTLHKVFLLILHTLALFSYSPLPSLLFFLCIYCVYLDLQFFSSYRKLLSTKIASLWSYLLNIKYCNNYLPKKLASTIKFKLRIYERHVLFILWDYLTVSNLLQTLTELIDLLFGSTSN